MLFEVCYFFTYFPSYHIFQVPSNPSLV